MSSMTAEVAPKSHESAEGKHSAQIRVIIHLAKQLKSSEREEFARGWVKDNAKAFDSFWVSEEVEDQIVKQNLESENKVEIAKGVEDLPARLAQHQEE